MENETREQAALTLRRGGKWRGYGLSRHQRRGRWKITRPDGGLYAQDYDLHSPNCGMSAAIERLLDEHFPPEPEVVVPPPKKKKKQKTEAPGDPFQGKDPGDLLRELAAKQTGAGVLVPPEWVEMARERAQNPDAPEPPPIDGLVIKWDKVEKKDSPPLIDPATGEEVVIFHDLQDSNDLL